VKIVVQTNAKESTPIYYCTTQEEVEVVVQTEPKETKYNDAKTEETPTYIT